MHRTLYSKAGGSVSSRSRHLRGCNTNWTPRSCSQGISPMVLSHNNQFVRPPPQEFAPEKNVLSQWPPKIDRTLERQSSRKRKAGRFLTKGGFKRKLPQHIRQEDMGWQSGATMETESQCRLVGAWHLQFKYWLPLPSWTGFSEMRNNSWASLHSIITSYPVTSNAGKPGAY